MRDPELQRLIDERDITWVLTEYCRTLDRMDLPALARLFTADCIVEYGPDERLRSRGAAALAQSLARMWRWARTSHHLSNVQIELDGSEAARAISYVYAWHERPDGGTAVIMGQYHDRLLRTAEGWRIAERRMLMNGCDQGFKVDINRFERLPPPSGWTPPKGLDK